MTRPLLPQDLPILEALGLRMQQARERRNISADLMAERIGVPLVTLHSLENGSAGISLADFYRALRILGLAEDIDWLAQDDEMVGKLLSIEGQAGNISLGGVPPRVATPEQIKKVMQQDLYAGKREVPDDD
jgi:transcriptional regulator with XRE-family HTH domain